MFSSAVLLDYQFNCGTYQHRIDPIHGEDQFTIVRKLIAKGNNYAKVQSQVENGVL